MAPKIIDAGGHERDLSWLRATYGNVQIEPATGQRFELIEMRETDGPSVLMVCLLNEQGLPHAGQPVGHWWPDPSAAATIDLSGGGMKTLPYARAAVERTDSTGWTGFGLGGGSYYDPAGQGPDVIWVLSPSVASDVVRGLGWLPGTNHRGMMRLTFRLVDDVSGVPEPEPEPGGGLVQGNSRLDRLMTLVVPQVAGTRKPATMVARAVETLALLEAEVTDDQ